MMKKSYLFWVLFFLTIALSLVVENEFSNSFRECVIQYSSTPVGKVDERQSLIIGKLVTQIACTVHFINFHVGFFSVLAAAFVAVFTFTLWGATKRLWQVSISTLETTERAFIYLDGFEHELATAADSKTITNDMLPKLYKDRPELYITRFALRPRWKNSGTTPTKKMKINVNIRGLEGVVPPDYAYKTPAVPFFVAPQAVEASEPIDIPHARIHVDWGLNPIRNEPIILIWGRADYEDIFGNERFIKWCYRLRFDRHDGKNLHVSFIQWGEHNDSDSGIPG